jgi:hypothetical protein
VEEAASEWWDLFINLCVELAHIMPDGVFDKIVRFLN